MTQWQKVRIGDFLFERKEKYQPNDESILKLKNIKKISFFDGKIHLKNYKPTQTKQIIVKPNDFVFSGLNIEKGAVSINNTKEKLVVSVNYSTCSVDYSIINQEYFLRFIRSTFFKKLLINNLKKDYGFTRPKHLLPLEINLPTIEEQKIIVKKLKGIESEENDLKQEISQQQTWLKKLRQQILQEAIEGKLTQDWRAKNPNTEPASTLLKRIQAEKQQLIKNKKLKKGNLTSKSIINRNFNIPIFWVWSKADKIFFVTKLAGFEYSKYIKFNDAEEVPVIRAQNVRPFQITKKNLKYIDKSTSKLLNRCALNKKALLVTFIGAGIGDVAHFNEPIRWHLAPNVAKLELFEGCDNMLDLKYFNIYLLSFSGRVEIFKHIKATAQPSLSMSAIRDIDFLIPPLAEQKAIVTKVEKLLGICDKLETQITTNQTHAAQLMQAVLKEAFTQSDQPIKLTD